MKQKEIILCAAINYKGIIICGHRHGDCYTVLRDLLSKYITPDDLPEREDQGFLTSFNRYVDREEAFLIAQANDQIQFGKDCTDKILISENLY